MANFNKVTLVGNLTRDVETRAMTTGVSVAGTGIAVNEFWTDKATGEKKERTMFIDLSAFGKTAELFSQYLKKGMLVLISGRLNYDTWEKEGQHFSKHSVRVEDFQILTPKKADEALQGAVQPSFTDGDVPF